MKRKNGKNRNKNNQLNLSRKSDVLDMTRGKQKISLCLVMIVKDEEDNIEKCLRSVSPYISYWVIVDTGSSDKTRDLILSYMDKAGIPGELHERKWVNFEVNRTESLNLAKGKCDYRWIIDADDEFFPQDPKVNPFVGIEKGPDAFQILYILNSLQFYRAQIVRSDQDWIYKGVLHEFLELPDKPDVIHGRIQMCHVKADISPLKRASSMEEKYSNDAKILEEELKRDPQNSRYVFYLAQSYRDSNQIDKSIENYIKRSEMGGWEEEVYYSLYMIAKLKETRGDNILEVTNAYSMAWEYRPQRLEAVFHTMRKLREQNRHVLAFTYGSIAIQGSHCNDVLFLEKEIWEWRFLDEYSLAAFYTGNPEIALRYCEPVISAEFFKHLPKLEQNRILKNIEYFKKAYEDKKKALKTTNNG